MVIFVSLKRVIYLPSTNVSEGALRLAIAENSKYGNFFPLFRAMTDLSAIMKKINKGDSNV